MTAETYNWQYRSSWRSRSSYRQVFALIPLRHQALKVIEYSLSLTGPVHWLRCLIDRRDICCPDLFPFLIWNGQNTDIGTIDRSRGGQFRNTNRLLGFLETCNRAEAGPDKVRFGGDREDGAIDSDVSRHPRCEGGDGERTRSQRKESFGQCTVRPAIISVAWNIG